LTRCRVDEPAEQLASPVAGTAAKEVGAVPAELEG